MADELYPRVFEPGRIGQLTVPNRLVMAPMDDNMADRLGEVTAQNIAWYERRAAGGVGLITVGCAYVTPAGRSASHFQRGIDHDGLIPALRRLTERVHTYDTRIGIQLCHSGRQTTSLHLPAGLRPEAPSEVTEPLLGEQPQALTLERIHEIVAEFAAAAVRAREAGFDTVEVHGAHGFLQHIFLSLLANRRDDEYGGSLENRARFSIECVQAIRAAVGDDFVVGYRLPCDDMTSGGVTLEDAVAVLGWLEQAGIDYVSVSPGRGGSYGSARMILAPPSVGPGHLEHYAASVRKVAKVPVMSAGRYDSPELAEGVLARGSADFIVMGRALIADPDLPLKSRTGRAGEIRPCVVCNQGCIDRWLASLDVTCAVNAEAGRESEPVWQTPGAAVEHPGRVLVIGGGPAGMEAARVAGLLGHDVTLWEASPELGGQLLLAARAPHQAEWGQYARWLAATLPAAGVDVALGVRATASDVEEFAADSVIVAAGARPWIPRHLPGFDLELVTDAFSVLAGRVEPGRRVVVVGGETIGARTALYLADLGCEVTLVAGGRAGLFDDPSDDVAYDMLGEVVRPMVLEWLAESVTVLGKRLLKEVRPDGVIIGTAGTFRPHLSATRVGVEDDEFIPADTVVLGTERRPNDELFEELRDSLRLRGTALALVGDAGRPRTVIEATAESSAAARQLGARELPTLG
jgi:2,4-dienoyl-CoA reductase-like NADH-dependent reductase (Old Yellow Enzyme family)/thioredoxin reductase